MELAAFLAGAAGFFAFVTDPEARRQEINDWVAQQTKTKHEATHEDMLAYYLEHTEDYSFKAKARWEERRLSARYPAYDAYAAHTPRFVPFWPTRAAH